MSGKLVDPRYKRSEILNRDLAMTIRVLVRKFQTGKLDAAWCDKALDLLTRNGLGPNPLRNAVVNRCAESVKRGQVLRWIPRNVSGRRSIKEDEQGQIRDLFLGRKRLADVESMEVAGACRPGGPFVCVERGGVGYIELRSESPCP